jgi:hypothetical protein
LLWTATLAVAILLVGYDAERLSAPFGPSHDGFNAALYMNGGRAIVEEGFLASRLGGTSHTMTGDRVVYAHHPPLVYLADAVAFGITSTELSARLPAIASSYIALVLLAFLLAACGLSSGAASVGLSAAFATPMFLMFGAMSEPHILGLAPMTALILLWQRNRCGQRVPSWMIGVVTAIATITSWQAALCAGIIGVTLLLLDRNRPAAAAALAGCAVAAILVGLWILWAYDGDGREFMARAMHRLGTGTGRVSFLQMGRRQVEFFNDLFPVGGWLMVPIAALGLFDRRTRAPVAVSLGTVVGYGLLFRNAAYDHNYWLYCILLPLTLGAAVAADGVTRTLSRKARLGYAPHAIAIALLVIFGLTLGRPSQEEIHRRWASEVGAQARALVWPANQRYAFHGFGDRGRTDLLPWVFFYSRREPFGVDGPQSVPRGQLMLKTTGGRPVTEPGEQVTTRE